jgi:hypothetical protein
MRLAGCAFFSLTRTTRCSTLNHTQGTEPHLGFPTGTVAVRTSYGLFLTHPPYHNSPGLSIDIVANLNLDTTFCIVRLSVEKTISNLSTYDR